MSLLAWLVVGLIAGFLASKVVNKTGEGLVLDILLGVDGVKPVDKDPKAYIAAHS